MKAIIAFVLLALPAFGAERVLLIRDGNLAPINELIYRGWKVKHQSVAHAPGTPPVILVTMRVKGELNDIGIPDALARAKARVEALRKERGLIAVEK